jgi:acetyl-CoA synthetase
MAGTEPTDDLRKELVAWVRKDIGPIASPDQIQFAPGLPKTRSGKIMRRVIAAVSNFTDTGDVTTLANPEIVDDIRHQVQAAKVAMGDVPRELTETEAAEIQSFGKEE